MATRIASRDAVELDLPGRSSREILSGAMGADCSIRLVEIAVPAAGATPRSPHWHPDSSESIHVLSGQGITWVEGADFALQLGDTIYVAAGERHVTRNTGDGPLRLLCVFPHPEFTMLTEDARAADA
jgi:quercetin dioxygenase-like cupin family protein